LAGFRAELRQDIRDHPLAWAVIVAGAISAALLWAMICGLPLAHASHYDAPIGAAAVIWTFLTPRP
jgi:hypothetical protein